MGERRAPGIQTEKEVGEDEETSTREPQRLGDGHVVSLHHSLYLHTLEIFHDKMFFKNNVLL